MCKLFWLGKSFFFTRFHGFMVDSSWWRKNYLQGFVLWFSWKSCRRFTVSCSPFLNSNWNCCIYVLLYFYVISFVYNSVWNLYNSCSFSILREILMNYFNCFSASAIFIGIYEPTKQKLLKICPENFSALAHLVSSLFYVY